MPEQTCCPRCGSADVAVQPKDTVEAGAGPDASLAAEAFAAPAASGEASLILTLIGGVFDLIGWLLKRCGVRPSPRIRYAEMVRFCHDCGWSEAAKR